MSGRVLTVPISQFEEGCILEVNNLERGVYNVVLNTSFEVKSKQLIIH